MLLNSFIRIDIPSGEAPNEDYLKRPDKGLRSMSINQDNT